MAQFPEQNNFNSYRYLSLQEVSKKIKTEIEDELYSLPAKERFNTPGLRRALEVISQYDKLNKEV